MRARKLYYAGFTLIELLVVIAIVSLLSTVVFGQLNMARIKAQDTSRVQRLEALRDALNMYYSDHGHYPATYTSGPPSRRWQCDPSHPEYRDDFVPEIIADGYISALPGDPALNCSGVSTGFSYLSDGTSYKLVVHPEGSFFPSFVDPATDGGPDGCIIDGTLELHLMIMEGTKFACNNI